MTRAKTLTVALSLAFVGVAGLAAACGGGSTPPANDTTTVSVEKPADSSAAPATSAPAK